MKNEFTGWKWPDGSGKIGGGSGCKHIGGGSSNNEMDGL